MQENVTILYVDDEPINLSIFELNFNKKYNVVTANDGNEGLEKLTGNEDIIVVISDMRMPKMNGLEFISYAKKTHPNIAYFILTGFSITDEISTALNNNLIHSYFKKPFEMEEIDNEIKKYIKSLE